MNPKSYIISNIVNQVSWMYHILNHTSYVTNQISNTTINIIHQVQFQKTTPHPKFLQLSHKTLPGSLIKGPPGWEMRKLEMTILSDLGFSGNFAGGELFQLQGARAWCFFFLTFSGSRDQVSYEKNLCYFPLNTGWLVAILMMAYYNPYNWVV